MSILKDILEATRDRRTKLEDLKRLNRELENANELKRAAYEALFLDYVRVKAELSEQEKRTNEWRDRAQSVLRTERAKQRYAYAKLEQSLAVIALLKQRLREANTATL